MHRGEEGQVPSSTVCNSAYDTEAAMNMHLEYTDTFGGEPNYAWVTRKSTEIPKGFTENSIIQLAKAMLGLSDVCCDIDDHGDTITLYPIDQNTVVFITFSED
jgi:hypothetical protein